MATICVLLALTLAPVAGGAVVARAADPVCFEDTHYCIDEPAFQEYFRVRGGARILGFPVSRVFTLEGFKVQFFQRVVLQLQGSGVARLNLLDPGVMPLTHANQSVFPAPDADLAAAAPRPDDPAYAQHAVEFLRSTAPDSWNGLPVGFFTLFNTTVPVDIALPGGAANPDLVTLLNLEIWGLPTSRPAVDPGNQGFVYQRFQRGIMHYRSDCGCTEGILVGDYLKAVLTGQNLPADLAGEMRGSRYFGQYAAEAPGWVARPSELGGTDLSGAFDPGPGPGPTSTVAPVAPTTVPPVAPTSAVPVTPTTVPTPSPTTVPPVTPTTVPTAVLSGTVDPPKADVRVSFLDLPFETTTGAGGAYSLPNLPFGKYQIYAEDTSSGRASDPQLVDLNAGHVGPVPLSLQQFEAGALSVLVGSVVGADKNTPVKDAVVWRLGGAGLTKSTPDGSFQLVDTFADVAAPKPKQRETLIATQGGRWGSTTVDFGNGGSKDPARIQLTHGSPAPKPPEQVVEFGKKPTQQTYSYKPNGKRVFFTARAPGAVPVTLALTDGSDERLPCDSDLCGGNHGTLDDGALVIKLPPDRSFTVTLPPSGWDEAQIVRYR